MNINISYNGNKMEKGRKTGEYLQSAQGILKKIIKVTKPKPVKELV